MNIELVITIIGGLSASFKWIYEYSKKLEWEKNKFMLDELEKFNSQSYVKIAEKMLDWNEIQVVIDKQIINVNDESLCEAIKTHDIKTSFSLEEVAIRKVFDEYFDSLTKLIFMSKVDLINQDNLKVFLDYWFKILSGKTENKPNNFVYAVRDYLTFYGFETLKNFLDEHYEHN